MDELKRLLGIYHKSSLENSEDIYQKILQLFNEKEDRIKKLEEEIRMRWGFID